MKMDLFLLIIYKRIVPWLTAACVRMCELCTGMCGWVGGKGGGEGARTQP
jgi:hypothetical protein